MWLTFFLLIGSSNAATPSNGCGKSMPSQPHPGHSHSFWITVTDPNLGDTQRHYKLHVPAAYVTSNDNPTPMVVDFHGWGGNANSQEKDSLFAAVADEDETGYFVLTAEGMSDMNNQHGWGSFNCSRTDGPLGPPCDTDRSKWGAIECYDSCPLCDGMNSCDWTSCHDDVLYTKTIIDTVLEDWCVDVDSIHQTGISNGGMFSYYVASRLDYFASIGPFSGSPMLGFGDVPSWPINLIDFHGLDDDTIPYEISMSEGEGPGGTIISWDGYYYYDKMATIQTYADGMGCGPAEVYPTDMDGTNNWSCITHKGCTSGGEVVHCSANYGHDYPFAPNYIEGTRIMWNFFKTHPLKK